MKLHIWLKTEFIFQEPHLLISSFAKALLISFSARMKTI